MINVSNPVVTVAVQEPFGLKRLVGRSRSPSIAPQRQHIGAFVYRDAPHSGHCPSTSLFFSTTGLSDSLLLNRLQMLNPLPRDGKQFIQGFE
jgi:hypothetical protein